MPFIELEDGSEILLDVSDIPEPPASTFTDNPYEANTTQFKRWRATAKARYAKAHYKATVDAKNEEHFLSLVGDAKSLLQDSSAWESYKSCRGLDEYRRPVGRPKLSEKEKLNRPPKAKRSDAMRSLLLENGVTVSEDGSLHSKDGFYIGWKFQINGRIKFMGDEEFNVEPYTLSAHQFISEYC